MSKASRILELLKASGEAELSGSCICGELGITRSAVWKHIKTLRSLGYGIEGHSRCGYRLTRSPDRPDAAEVSPLLRTRVIGRTIYYSESTASTNADAFAGAEAGCEEGTVYCAGAQTGGRGRMNRPWFSPAGVNLYFSAVLRPKVPIDRAASLPLVAGVAVASVMKKLDSSLEPKVKWPNDILVKERKICGILCEMQSEIDFRVRHIVVGAGINVNLAVESLPEELRSKATSLRAECGREFALAGLLAEVLNGFETLYDLWQAEGFAPLAELMKQYDGLAGREISVRQGRETLTGTACGVQDDGALRLQTGNGIMPVYSGEATVASF